MGILLCEQNFRDVWRQNQNVRAAIGQILHTHTHTRGSISSKVDYLLLNTAFLVYLNTYFMCDTWPYDS